MNRMAIYHFLSGTASADEPAHGRAHSKSGFAATRQSANVHRVHEMAVFRDGDRLRYAAKWLCGVGSVDAIPIKDPDGAGGRCGRCDDRLADLEFGLIAVYRCYDSDGVLLYVGSTINGVRNRMSAHRRAAWWPLMDPDRTRLERFESEFQARAAERRAIGAEHPTVQRYRPEGVVTCRKFGGVILCGDDAPTRPRKPCSVCGRVLARYEDGTIKAHLDGVIRYPPAHCAGSRRPPAAVTS